MDRLAWRGYWWQICAIEVARHRWLRLITVGGCSRRTFLITGLIALAISVALGVSIASK